MSYTRPRNSVPALSGVGSSTLSPALVVVIALAVGGVYLASKDKPLRANKGHRRLRRNSRRRRSSRR